MIAIKIDLTKIPKDKIFVGKKGKYIDAVLFEKDSTDEWGNTHVLLLSQSREEREQGADKIYLGNGKLIGQTNSVPPKGNIEDATVTEDYGDLPF